MGAPALVDALGVLLQRTYDIPPSSLGAVSRFVVGDEGHRRLLEGRRVVERVDRRRARARLLLRRRHEGWALALYLPDALGARLEARDPRRGISEHNVDEFLALVEEVDHLVTFADRAGHGDAEVSLLELEWHAAVSKVLVATHFVARLAGQERLSAGALAFIDYHAFHKARYPSDDLNVQEESVGVDAAYQLDVFANFAAAIRGQTDLIVPPAETLALMEILDRCRQSSQGIRDMR